ncbi:exosome complex component RRP46 [Coccinella septempunctata]|uniref:exosome complex component RRP46 n=1 Tax=Coccinella septempunctata TaxID=41139 RepID=UPI001D089483|nr:exosome complex component RRP46 [Coccinella septempunctata]
MENTTPNDEILELKCQFDTLTRPDGSVLFCEGETTVLAGVYGPVECKGSKLLTDKAFIEMNFRPKSGLPCVQDKFFEATLKTTCEAALAAALHPRSSIVITIQEMHNNGQLLSCAINATCLACLDSNIDMKFLFASTTCFLTTEGNLEMKTPKKNYIQAIFVFTFDSMKGHLLVSHTEGVFSLENYKSALEKCREQSKHVFKFMKNQITRRICT